MTIPLLLLLTSLTTAVTATSVVSDSSSKEYLIQSRTLDNMSRLDIPSDISDIRYKNVTLFSTCEFIDRKVKMIKLDMSTIQTLCIHQSLENIMIFYCNISQLVITSQAHNELFNTTKIEIWNSPIRSLPSNICTLTKLSIIRITDGNLKRVNLSIFIQLNNLKILRMDRCNIFEAVVDGPIELFSLNIFSVEHNSIKRIDMYRWNMPRLKYLYLSNNQLSEFPPLNRFPNLQDVLLSKNFINIVNMSQISGLANLGGLYLSDNRILHLYALEPVQLPALYCIDLDRNFLQTLNLSAWNAPRLGYLHLQDNLLHGIDGIESIADSVKEIYLSGNLWSCVWLKNVTIKLKKSWSDDCIPRKKKYHKEPYKRIKIS